MIESKWRRGSAGRRAAGSTFLLAALIRATAAVIAVITLVHGAAVALLAQGDQVAPQHPAGRR